MAALQRTWLARKCLAKHLMQIQGRQISSTSPLAAEWNHNWQPGPCPKNEAEMKAAAKKYGVEREDYQPMVDDGSAHGDYIDLPFKGEYQKDMFHDWDNPALKRDFNEPMHIYWDILVSDRANPGADQRFSAFTMVAAFCTIWLGFIGTCLFSHKYPKRVNEMDASYPYDDVKAYKQKKFEVDEPVKRVKHYSF